MNAAIRAITRKAIHEGFSVYGIERGFEGIINSEIRPLHARDVGGIITTGGTILRTARYPEYGCWRISRVVISAVSDSSCSFEN